MENKVFVSYCRKDLDILKQFLCFMEPLQREGWVDVWHENRMKPGEYWAAEIVKALREASAAVLFVSQDFLASKFIYEQELPHILSEAQAGRLTLLPVYLSPSTVQTTLIPFIDHEKGLQQETTLDKYQGLNTPDKPLSEKSWSDRERVYIGIAEYIRELTEHKPIAVAAPSPGRLVFTRQALPGKIYMLNVEFKRDGDELCTAYSLPESPVFLQRKCLWASVERQIKPLLNLIRSNRATVQGVVDISLIHWGEVLFEILFGENSEDHTTLFRSAFYRSVDEPEPTPAAAPLRLHVVSNDHSLLQLPWSLTAWQNMFLVDKDWLFLTGTEIARPSSVKSVQPLSVLLIVPDDSEHRQSLLALFKELWPQAKTGNCVRAVATRQELSNVLADFDPQIVYYFAEDRNRNGTERLYLRTDSGFDPLRLVEFAQLFATHRVSPNLIYLNVPAPETEFAPPYSAFEQRLPLLIWRRLCFPDDAAKSIAIAWFRRWLQHNDDPAAALQQVLNEKYATDAEMVSLCVSANFRDWQTEPPVDELRNRFSHLLIDREKQKSMSAKWLAEFVSSDSLRVMVLVPFAEPGNCLDLLHERLCDHCKVQLSDKIAIDTKNLQFPESRVDLCRSLEHELILQLKADPGEAVQHLLRRHAPKTSGSIRPVLWFNWRLCGNSNTALKPTELEAWLNFAANFLTHQCPPDLFIICYTAIEVARSRYSRLKDNLRIYHRRFVEPSFCLRLLEPLDNVEEQELLDFLQGRAQLANAKEIDELAQSMIQVTAGKFEALLGLVRRAESEDSSWYDILYKLRREQGDVRKDNDDAF